MREQRFIDLCLKLCQQSEHKYKMAAILTQGSRIVSFGINKCRSHPRQINPYTKGRGVSIHAELDALLKARTDQCKGAVLYIARRLASGGEGMARPCSSCLILLKELEVKAVVYTTNKGIEKERLS